MFEQWFLLWWVIWIKTNVVCNFAFVYFVLFLVICCLPFVLVPLVFYTFTYKSSINYIFLVILYFTRLGAAHGCIVCSSLDRSGGSHGPPLPTASPFPRGLLQAWRVEHQEAHSALLHFIDFCAFLNRKKWEKKSAVVCYWGSVYLFLH